MLAALEQTAVPLALQARPGSPSPTPRCRRCADALQGELARTLRVALPQAAVDGGIVDGDVDPRPC